MLSELSNELSNEPSNKPSNDQGSELTSMHNAEGDTVYIHTMSKTRETAVPSSCTQKGRTACPASYPAKGADKEGDTHRSIRRFLLLFN